MMKRALLVTHQFPPIGGPLATRSFHLARHLPRFGYEVVVITSTTSEDFWAPRASISRDGLEELEVHKLPTVPHGPRRARLERLIPLTNSLGRQFEERAAEFAATPLVESIDVMIVELGPYQLGTTGMRLSRQLGVPWVADLLDPWALDEMWLYPTGLHRRLDRRRMHETLKNARAVIMNTQEAAHRVRRAFPDLVDHAVHTVPCGYAADDFEDALNTGNRVFRIVHAGSLHTQWGLRQQRTGAIRRALGGMPVPGVDILPRSHVFLMAAVEKLMRNESAFASSAEVHLVGLLSEADRLVAKHVPLVRTHGYQTHAETIRMMRSADLLFLPMHGLPEGVRAGLVPAKTYEYMASGRPILAAVPIGDARDLLSEVGTATIVGPRDVDAMARAIDREFQRWRRGESPPSPNRQVVDQYEYRRLVERVASVLDAVIGHK